MGSTQDPQQACWSPQGRSFFILHTILACLTCLRPDRKHSVVTCALNSRISKRPIWMQTEETVSRHRPRDTKWQVTQLKAVGTQLLFSLGVPPPPDLWDEGDEMGCSRSLKAVVKKNTSPTFLNQWRLNSVAQQNHPEIVQALPRPIYPGTRG